MFNFFFLKEKGSPFSTIDKICASILATGGRHNIKNQKDATSSDFNSICGIIL